MNFSNIQIPKIRISVRVVAVLIGLIGVAFLWWATKEKIPEIDAKTSTLVTENKTLTETELNLSTLYNNMPFYLEETTRLNDETEDILSEFPTFMYLEDKILYADTLMKTDFAAYNVTDFSYGDSNYITNVSYGDGKLMELYSVNMSSHYTDLVYTEVKDILNYGLSASQRFVINSLTMSFNEQSGYLNGDISFTTYFIPGQPTPYEFPDNVVVGLGNSNRVDNLFGSRPNNNQNTVDAPIDDSTTPVDDDVVNEDIQQETTTP